mmetsp:Transcript_130385/g.260103  ORF Transcript_130385/g.260103 Transcript_130385/m.260103 type:complete len:652 (+) Transcript_130385:99-2054(+)
MAHSKLSSRSSSSSSSSSSSVQVKKAKKKKKKKQKSKKGVKKKDAKRTRKAKKADKKAKKALKKARKAEAVTQDRAVDDVPQALDVDQSEQSSPRTRPCLPSCPDCSRELTWSDYDGGAYRKGGWVCNHVKTCGSKLKAAGRWRWNCRKCTNDFCGDCKGWPEGSQKRARSQSVSSTPSRAPSACSSSSEESIPDVHAGISCAACGVEPIKGHRFQCAICPAVSLCTRCHRQKDKLHTSSHKFFAMRAMVPPRQAQEHSTQIVWKTLAEDTQEVTNKIDTQEVTKEIDTQEVAKEKVQAQELVAAQLPPLISDEPQQEEGSLPLELPPSGADDDEQQDASDVAGVDLDSEAQENPMQASQELPDGEVCFVRHAQALHNVRRENINIRDNPLTAEGLVECTLARSEWASEIFREAGLIVVSPLRRALVTAVELNSREAWDGRFFITALCTERWSARCDEGNRKSQLLHEFPWLRVWQGLDDLPEIWWPQQREDERKRLNDFLSFLRSRQEKKIVVVSHGGFLGQIVGFKLTNVGHHTMGMKELRSKSFEPRPAGKVLQPKGQCSLCLRLVFDFTSGVICRRRRDDASMAGCGEGFCWQCMSGTSPEAQASPKSIGKFRITKEAWERGGIHAWWMHEECMTILDRRDFKACQQ